MTNPNNPRTAFDLLVIFVGALTLMALLELTASLNRLHGWDQNTSAVL